MYLAQKYILQLHETTVVSDMTDKFPRSKVRETVNFLHSSPLYPRSKLHLELPKAMRYLRRKLHCEVLEVLQRVANIELRSIEQNGEDRLGGARVLDHLRRMRTHTLNRCRQSHSIRGIAYTYRARGLYIIEICLIKVTVCYFEQPTRPRASFLGNLRANRMWQVKFPIISFGVIFYH